MFRMISLLTLVLAVSACASRPPIEEHVTGQEVPVLELSEREYEWDEDKSTALNFAHLGQAEGAFRDWDTPDGGQREVSSGGSFLRSAAMFWSTGGSVGMTAADQAATSSQARRYEEDPFGLLLVPTDELAAHQQEYDDGGFRLVYELVTSDMINALEQADLDAEFFPAISNQQINDYRLEYSRSVNPVNHFRIYVRGESCEKAAKDNLSQTVNSDGPLDPDLIVGEGQNPSVPGDCISLFKLSSLGSITISDSGADYHAFRVDLGFREGAWLREIEANADALTWVIPTSWRVRSVKAASKVPYVRHGDSRYFFTHDDSSEPVEDGLSPYILYDNDPQFQEEG